MGVDVEFIVGVGLYKEYEFIHMYDNKNCCEYTWDEKDGSLKLYKNIVFKDYLPSNFDVVSDNMSGANSWVGLVLHKTDDLYNGIDVHITPEKFSLCKQEVIEQLKSLNIDFDPEDIKINIFTNFS